jgi:hypothetical protein
MISLFCIILTLGLSSCGLFTKKHEKSPNADTRLTTLSGEYVKRKAAYEEITLGTQGWPSVNDCDATLWAGEVCSAGLEVQISAAEYPVDGQVQRRPISSCFFQGHPNGSDSSVSNDMILGYLSCLWQQQDLHALQRLADYGEAHNWVMGEPADSDRVYMKPNQQGLLGRMLAQLGDNRSYRKIPPEYLPVEKDFEKHLQVLGILLNGQVDSNLHLLDIRGDMYNRLEALAEDDQDALMQAAFGTYTGDMSKALDLLLLPETPIPSYVRGNENYKLVYWLKAASVVLNSFDQKGDL